jgi:hypothetical protein
MHFRLETYLEQKSRTGPTEDQEQALAVHKPVIDL